MSLTDLALKNPMKVVDLLVIVADFILKGYCWSGGFGLSLSLSEDSVEELESLDDDSAKFIKPSTFFKTPSIIGRISGRAFRKHFNQCWQNFGLPANVLRRTRSKFTLEQKFWVKATVSVKFRTTCHHPPGTNMTSPGYCTASMGLHCFNQLGELIRPYTVVNQVIASLGWMPPSFFVGFKIFFGVCGWKKHHFLEPLTRAF